MDNKFENEHFLAQLLGQNLREWTSYAMEKSVGAIRLRRRLRLRYLQLTWQLF